jgi:hypothetical protein
MPETEGVPGTSAGTAESAASADSSIFHLRMSPSMSVALWMRL